MKNAAEWQAFFKQIKEALWTNLKKFFTSLQQVVDNYVKGVRYHTVKRKKGPGGSRKRVVIAQYSRKMKAYITEVRRVKLPNRKGLHQ